jgi:hypothetical protein
MPFKKTKQGYEYSDKGSYRIVSARENPFSLDNLIRKLFGMGKSVANLTRMYGSEEVKKALGK